MPVSIDRPQDNEYDPYYGGYIRRVPDGNILDILTTQMGVIRQNLNGLSDTQANFRFAPGEWSIKEVIGHIIDAERIFAYRALCISRAEAASLPGFEQDDYVREANFDARSLADLIDEFECSRRANILAFKYLSPETSSRLGTASGKPVSVRALVYIMVGHVNHHLESLQNEYLNQARAN